MFNILYKNVKFFFNKRDLIKDSQRISKIANKFGTARVLYHNNEKNNLHIMFICHKKNYLLDPFKYKYSKNKIFVLVKGEAEFQFYNSKGRIIKTSKFNKNNNFIILNENFYFYRQKIFSNKILFFEITPGPYLKKNNIYLKHINEKFPSYAVKQNILYLTNKTKAKKNNITKFVEKFGDKVFIYSKKDIEDIIIKKNIHFIISDRYKHIISKNILDKFKYKAINLHHSYLPYGRGWNPIFWSIFRKKIFGATIHYLNKKIDAGNIINQKKIKYNQNDTLIDLYARVRKELEKLFRKSWLKIKNNKTKSIKNEIKKGFIYYRKNDYFVKKIIKNKLWNTKVVDIQKNLND